MSNTTVDTPDKAMEKWQADFDLLQSFAGGAWGQLREVKEEAMASFVKKGFPTTKWEEWKYTSVRKISEGEFTPVFRLPETEIDQESGAFYDQLLPAGLQTHVVVLVNGHFHPGLSRILEDEVTILPLQKAIRDGQADAHYGKIAHQNQSPFIALNTAMAMDGVYIHLAKSKTAKYPVTVLHLGYSSGAGEVASYSRKLIVVEDNAELKVIEKWVQWTDGRTFENHVSEIQVGADARVELNTIQNEKRLDLINFTQVNQEQNSHFHSNCITLQGELIRNNLHSLHMGEHVETHMNGLYLLDGKAHVDNHTLVDHAMPNCYSNELYKGVLSGKSTAVFNGKVMVRPDAQKTNAFQSNKTILLSEGATINTKPQLEIFADDVKCSHGATTGRLDETALFYLRSRGLDEKRARALLTYAFASEVINNVTISELQAELADLVSGRLFEEDNDNA